MINNFYVDRAFSMNPSIPSTYDESMSYYEVISKLITYVNQLYEQYVSDIGVSKDMTDKYNQVLTELVAIKKQFKEYIEGKTIPNGSVTLEKLGIGVMEEFKTWVEEYMYSFNQFVSFGLTDDGHFVVYTPTTWKDIVFTTDVEGHLVLNF